MKKILSFILCVLMISALFVPFAMTGYADVTEHTGKRGVCDDEVGLISDETFDKIVSIMQEAYDKYDCSICIHYVNYVDSDDDQRDRDAEDIYLNNNFCQYGAFLYLGVYNRSFDIYVRHGSEDGIITYNEGDRLNEAIMPYLRQDKFDEAALVFAEKALEFAGNDEVEKFYLGGKTKSEIIGNCVTGLIIGFIISLIIVSGMKKKNKTVIKQHAATNYIDEATFVITESRDSFLYSNVVRTARQTSSSSGGGGSHSSGGGSHHGGHF